jgi:hypothetical protein
MRLVREHVVRAWEQRKDAICRDVADIEHRARRFSRSSTGSTKRFCSLSPSTLRRIRSPQGQARQELTLLDIGRHSSEVENLDVDGILAFAERVLPRGCRPRSISDNAFSSCSSRMEWRSTENGLFEPG